jgi:excisionase family DNA binding protein
MAVQMPNEAITPTTADVQMARRSSEALALLLGEKGAGKAQLHFSTAGGQEAKITLPLPATQLLYRALQEMAKGNAVTLIPVDAELTTQQAAEILRISRPSLIKMLDDKKLPYRRVGAHRRVRHRDILAYLETEKAARKEVLKELIAEQERLGLYE